MLFLRSVKKKRVKKRVKKKRVKQGQRVSIYSVFKLIDCYKCNSGRLLINTTVCGEKETDMMELWAGGRVKWTVCLIQDNLTDKLSKLVSYRTKAVRQRKANKLLMRHFLYPYTFLGLNVSLSAYNYVSATPSKSPPLHLSTPKPLKLEVSTSLSLSLCLCLSFITPSPSSHL